MDRRITAVRAARAGAALAAELFRTGLDVETKDSATDFVTEADRRTQERIVEFLAEEYPDDPVVGEEGDGRKRLQADETAWIVDPIDGTTNYVRDIPLWATSVAVVVDGDPVAAANCLPMLGDEYHAGTDDVIRTTYQPDGPVDDGDSVTVSDASSLEASIVAPTLRYTGDGVYGSLLGALSPHVGDVRRFGSAQTTLSLVAGGHLDAAVGVTEAHPWDTVAGVHLIERAGGTVTDLDGDPWTPRSEGLVASNGRIHDALLAVL
ncbi:inositol monophosphatase family protein [Haloplanus ruber]|uniref:fructose-bisphosphatase n=1 Tax=Haloplanus ruber TaxID=869892 RepID=A0ABD6D1R5_9EURY|nr:inositol monophosphatase [Haloplanus ruber]